MTSLARQSSWITVLTAAGLGLGFVNMALLFPRFLTADEFGLTRLVVSISAIAAQVAQLGMEATVIRYFPYFRDGARRHNGLFSLALLVGTIGAALAIVVLILLRGHLTAWFSDASGLYAGHGVMVLPLTVAEVYFILLRGFSRTLTRSIPPVFAREFLLRALQTALVGAYAIWKLPFGVFVWAYASTFILTTAVLLFDLFRTNGLRFVPGKIRLPRRMARSMIRYGLFTLATGISGIAVGNVDQLMLAAMLRDGLAYVAYYAVALFMASTILVPSRAMLIPVLPVVAEAWRKRDLERIGSIYRRTGILQLMLGTFIFICIAVNIDPLFSFLGAEYGAAKPAMIVLGCSNVLALASGLSGGIVSTSRRYAFDAYTGLLFFSVNFVLDFVLIKWLGMIGAAWSSLGAVIFLVAWRVSFLGRRFGIWPFEARTLVRIPIPVCASAAVFLLPGTGLAVIDIVLRCGAVAVCMTWRPSS